jgi:hypothetical protein
MVFGGDVSQTASSLSGNDSAYILDMSSSYQSASWSAVDSSWGQPERRLYQSSDTDGKGGVWFVGGERDDGSYIELDEMWSLNASASSPAFQQQAAPIGGLVGSTSTMMSDGSLLVLGGMNTTGLQSLSEISYYSTTSGKWMTTTTRGVNDTGQGFPSPRMSHVAVSLPHRRVLIHGGGTAQWASAMSDSWILDWSQDPPTWSDISSSSTNAPSARFGHSAVALGDVVVTAFGWAGNNPADSAVYVFDATSLSSSSAGVWTGGRWTTSYTPDITSSSSSSSNSGTTSGNTGSNGSSSGNSKGNNSGASNSGSSSNGNGKGSSSTSTPLSNPANTGDTSDQPKQNQSSSSTGTKAGAAVGALLGVGLIAGAGYLVYRKRRPEAGDDNNDFTNGDGLGLLRGTNHYYGADDDPYQLEKGIEYTGVGMGGIASFQAGTRPLGPRTATRTSDLNNASAWSMANIGHAMEGSGPHLRERLALMTGIGLGGAAAARQQRFDMLADEDDDRVEEKAYDMDGTHEDDQDDDERYNGVARRVREGSYGKVDRFDDEYHGEEHSYGDLAGIGAGYHGEGYVTSPFEDTAIVRDTDDESTSFINTIDSQEASDNTSQSRQHSMSSNAAQHSHSSASNATAHKSFSDSSPPKARESSSQPSSYMRRSPTWWDRFMGQSFLERTASGRLLPGPRAEEPIRDPTEPPALGAIREGSGGSSKPNRGDPFGEGSYATTDEMGRYYEPYAEQQHSKSMSSVKSGNTVTSSIMEARLQNMDVVQRVGTASSRRTFSTGRDGSTSSSGGLSRGTSMRNSTGHHFVASPVESTPGEVIFDGNNWNAISSPLPGTVEEGDETVQGLGDTSMDIVELSRGAAKASGQRKRSNTSETIKGLAAGMKRSKTTTPQGRAAKIREASEAPSLTPSTTKRARQNRQLTAPISPAPDRRLAPPVRGSVLDRVKAIEKKRVDEGEALLPVPRSPALSDTSPAATSPIASPDIFIPGRGGQPILTRLNINNENHDNLVSSPLTMTTPDKRKYSHGLVPKPQLFVANPDGRQSSADS